MCVSGGVYKHSLAMMDVCVGVSEWTLDVGVCRKNSVGGSGYFAP